MSIQYGAAHFLQSVTVAAGIALATGGVVAEINTPPAQVQPVAPGAGPLVAIDSRVGIIFGVASVLIWAYKEYRSIKDKSILGQLESQKVETAEIRKISSRNSDRLQAVEEENRGLREERAKVLEENVGLTRKLIELSHAALAAMNRVSVGPMVPLLVSPIASNPAAPPVPLPSRRMLFVEDDDYARLPWTTMFETLGWDVTAVGTVSEAVAHLEPPPAVVVLDLMLKDGGDGADVLKAVRERGIPAKVFITTGRDKAQLGYLDVWHPDGFFPKPLDIAGLAEALGTPLGQSR